MNSSAYLVLCIESDQDQTTSAGNQWRFQRDVRGSIRHGFAQVDTLLHPQAHILDLHNMAGSWSLAVLTLLSAFRFGLCSAAGSRSLQQSNGPGAVYGRPASATTADLKNDPQGRQHLLVRRF